MKNKNSMFIGLAGILIGFIVMGVVVFLTMPGLMLLEDRTNYDFATSVERFKQAVEDNGWKVIGVHNMRETLAELGYDVLEVKIIEICSARYSARILELDDERIVSALMPCRVAIYEKSNGNVYVSRMNSRLMAIPMGGVIAEVMGLASVATETIISSIIGEKLTYYTPK